MLLLCVFVLVVVLSVRRTAVPGGIGVDVWYWYVLLARTYAQQNHSKINDVDSWSVCRGRVNQTVYYVMYASLGGDFEFDMA